MALRLAGSDDYHGRRAPTLLQVLLDREHRYYHMLVTSESALSFGVEAESEIWLPTAAARNRIGDWALRIMDHYLYPRECVSVALNYMDRMIHTFPCPSCRDYQLLAVGCVFLAMKLSGNTRVLTVGCMAHHIEGRFSKQQIIDMESRVLTGLDWLVHPPTAMDFLGHYWTALVVCSDSFDGHARQDIIESATYLIDHCIIDSFFSVQKPSVIAMAALSLIIEVENPSFLNPESFQRCRDRMQHFTRKAASTPHQPRTDSPVSVSTAAPQSDMHCLQDQLVDP